MVTPIWTKLNSSKLWSFSSSAITIDFLSDSWWWYSDWSKLKGIVTQKSDRTTLTEAVSSGRANAKPRCDKHFWAILSLTRVQKSLTGKTSCSWGQMETKFSDFSAKYQRKSRNHFIVQDGLKNYSPDALITREDWVPPLSPFPLERFSGIYRHVCVTLGGKGICICFFTNTCAMYKVCAGHVSETSGVRLTEGAD